MMLICFPLFVVFSWLLKEETASHVDMVRRIRSCQPIVFRSCLHECLDDVLKLLSGEQTVFQADLTGPVKV